MRSTTPHCTRSTDSAGRVMQRHSSSSRLRSCAWQRTAALQAEAVDVGAQGLVQTLAAGRRPSEASLIRWLLQGKALIMTIVANLLLDKQIITIETFTALLLMAVSRAMVTLPALTPMLAKMKAVLARSR